jgi:hypothetical protein
VVLSAHYATIFYIVLYVFQNVVIPKSMPLSYYKSLQVLVLFSVLIIPPMLKKMKVVFIQLI